MGLFNFWGNYNKPGPGVNKDEPPKAAPIRFFEIYFRKLSKLVQINLIFLIPLIAVSALMILFYASPTHFTLELSYEGDALRLDAWNLYVVPIPLILLAPFTAGLTLVTRNFVREEHAFVWSDFWEAVKNNWKYFLLNGVVIYLAYVVLSYSLIYYYTRAASEPLFYILFWLCILITLLFLFAQYYIPVMFVTFDLRFGQIYKNALIFILAGLGRNFLITVLLVALLCLVLLIPLPFTILAAVILILFFLFSFISFLINFTVYPVIDRYMVQPYYRKLEEEKESADVKREEDPLAEKFPGLFENDAAEEEEPKEKYVYINGKLVKQSPPEDKENDGIE